MLLNFQVYLAWTLHLKPRRPCSIISNELSSVFFQLFSFWLLLDKSSMPNRCPMRPFSSEPMTGGFHPNGWERRERGCVLSMQRSRRQISGWNEKNPHRAADSGGTERLTLLHAADNKLHAPLQRRRCANFRIRLSMNGRDMNSHEDRKRHSRIIWAPGGHKLPTY